MFGVIGAVLYLLAGWAISMQLFTVYVLVTPPEKRPKPNPKRMLLVAFVWPVTAFDILYRTIINVHRARLAARKS